MDFDLDDPLDDILKSDNSDSFFDSKNVAKKSVPPKTEQKSKMSNLFGIKSETETAKPEQSSIPTPAEPIKVKQPEAPKPVISKPSTPAVKSPKPGKKKEVSFDDEDADDIFNDLGFDPKSTKAKTNIFDDILDTPKKPEPKPVEIKPKQTHDWNREPRPKSTPKTPTRENTQLNDPLGLFSSSAKKEEKLEKDSNFDWLGLKPVENVSRKNSIKEQEPIKPIEIPKKEDVPKINQPVLQENTELVLLETLKQQESQLIMASQMKSQENILIDMQRRQQELIKQQESKFNQLLQKQIQRQSVLEETIKNQQTRINDHIQVLMNQPMDNSSTDVEENTSHKTVTKPRDEEMIEMQNDVKRLELEKLRLEDLYSNSNGMHEQEIKFVEESFKKMEKRLRKDNEDLEEFYQNKIQSLESEKKELVQKYDERIKELIKDHEISINNIRQSKLFEFSLMQENASYLSQLKMANSHLENATGNIEGLKDTILSRIETVQMEKERELNAKEKKLNDEQKRVNLIQETAQEEQKRLLGLIHSLELKLSELSKESNEEQWVMRQKLMSLESERSAFEREQKYFRDQQIRDEKRIEELKEKSTLEYQTLMDEIQTERQKLIEEKVKFETLQKLNYREKPSLSVQQNELEIALKVAKEGARQSDLEREGLLGMQKQFELKKREMVDYENKIRRKEVELEMIIQLAKQREQKAEDTIRNSKILEQKILSKYQQLTRNIQEFVEREKRLNEDQQILSKERLEVQNLRKQASENKCTNCLNKSGNITENYENFNYNDLNLGQGSLDGIFQRELNEILKNIPYNTENDLSQVDAQNFRQNYMNF